MSPGAAATVASVVAAGLLGLLTLVLEKNIWLAAAMAGFGGAMVFFATYSYYTELARSASPDEPRPPRRAIPFTSEWRTRRLVAAGRLDAAGRRLAAADDWGGARRLIASEVRLRQIREPLLHLLHASRGLGEIQASLPSQTPEAFRFTARDTVDDVSQRLWAKAATLARLSQVTLPSAAEAEVAAEAQRIEEFAVQVESATTDLLKLSLAGYDSHGTRRGTELLTALRRKAKVLLSVGSDDLG